MVGRSGNEARHVTYWPCSANLRKCLQHVNEKRFNVSIQTCGTLTIPLRGRSDTLMDVHETLCHVWCGTYRYVVHIVMWYTSLCSTYYFTVIPLRWHVSHSPEVTENINLGYSQDQGYS